MAVRAKFKVHRIERSMGLQCTGRDERGREVYAACELHTIVLQPVFGNGDPNHENTRFWQASPSGEIKLGIINQAAWETFELNGEYYVDFTKAD